MLRLNLMPRSQADDLLRYFGLRLAEAVARGATQQEIGAALGVSGAQISMLISGKRTGMRIHNAEELAAYLKMPLVDALQAAVGSAGGAEAEADFRERALRRLDGLLSREVVDTVRRVPSEPGRARSEFEWLMLAVDEERVRRARGAITADTATAMKAVEGATAADEDEEGKEHTPPPITQRLSLTPSKKKKAGKS